jgi:hypothetical protein
MLSGLAWAPQNGVKHVDVRVDGRGWKRAQIRRPIQSKYAWVQFQIPWNATPGRHVIETRTTDNDNEVQPESVPYNQGGFDFWAVPKFHVDVA